jgi:outer membrane biosynthesis protein TonB
MLSTAAMAERYRLPIFGGADPLLRRACRIAAPIGLVVLLVGLLVPRRSADIAIDQLPERFAKLVLVESRAPKDVAPRLAQSVAKAVIETPPAPVAEPAPAPAVKAPVVAAGPARRTQENVVPEHRGSAGRERAKEATQQLASATSSIDGLLSGLDQALASTGTTPSAAPSPSRRRSARGGRSAAQVGAGNELPAGGGAGDDGAGSALVGARIEIAALGALQGEGLGGGGSASGSTGGGGASGSGASGDLRSDASLLAVVRKYAAGIRFCYENELKKDPTLGGKLVVAITVAAAGNVSSAVIVQDTLGAAPLTSCALAQIHAWRFPVIPAGDVTVRAPFVFTPPE